MEIYLIRHGQTDWNNKLLIQGLTDNKLNDIGIKQAHEISYLFDNIKPTKLFSSPLTRAKQTLNIIKDNQNWDISIKENNSFIERDFGELEGQDVQKYSHENDYSHFKYFEQNEELEKRVSNGIENIIKNSDEQDIILISCHSHTMKSFLINYYPQDYNYKTKLKNCEIIKVNIENKKIKSLDFINKKC